MTNLLDWNTIKSFIAAPLRVEVGITQLQERDRQTEVGSLLQLASARMMIRQVPDLQHVAAYRLRHSLTESTATYCRLESFKLARFTIVVKFPTPLVLL